MFFRSLPCRSFRPATDGVGQTVGFGGAIAFSNPSDRAIHPIAFQFKLGQGGGLLHFECARRHKEAYVHLGFQSLPTREELKRCIEEQNIDAMKKFFDKIAVKPGYTLFIPGGIPHSIGEGIFMVEIMEPPDLAVRFEFERGGYTLTESARFMNRGLDFCLGIFDFDAKPESQVRNEYMFEPKLEATYGKAAQRYHLIGDETTPCSRVKKSVIKGVVEREESTFFPVSSPQVLVC